MTIRKTSQRRFSKVIIARVATTAKILSVMNVFIVLFPMMKILMNQAIMN